ncbi:MAG: hypothetical protein KDA47_22910, partial [Planctomycetales bacterium]|nr:hypothetical protein [Planctomycetales bacterium]
MLSTTVFAAILLALLIASAVLWALLLRIGLRWGQVPGVTKRRVALATAITASLYLASSVLLA